MPWDATRPEMSNVVQQLVWDVVPLILAMLVLLGFSAFFSASEAAMFSLQAGDRAALKNGGRRQHAVLVLLEDPDRLLSAILFCNLVVNVFYFALASQVALHLGELPRVGRSVFAAFTAGALLVIIFCSEMLPKSVAVLKAQLVATWVSLPLSLFVRLVDPLMPSLRIVNLLSRRLLWPRFEPESYLQVEDLERAIELSSDDAQLIDHERRMLRNLVALSDLRVDECMRPRSQLTLLRPPVHWQKVEPRLSDSEYVFITESDSDEITASIDLAMLTEFPECHLEHLATSVVYKPWSAKVADVLQHFDARERRAIVVVNEWGETMGAVIYEDILDVMFMSRSTRSERLWNRAPVTQIGTDQWQSTGMTNLSALSKFFSIPLPESGHVTLAGVLQEELQRLPQGGDVVTWGPWKIEVVEAESEQPIVVHLTFLQGEVESP